MAIYSARRVAARYLRSDLSPPLGVGGGPCKVIERIYDTALAPKVRDRLTDKVLDGLPLDNHEARAVYPLSHEHGSAFREFTLSSHVQYRLDLRSITVGDVRTALDSMAAQLKGWAAAGDPRYEQVLALPKIQWEDPRTRLEVVVTLGTNGQLTLVTAYWRGSRDPAAPSSCEFLGP